MDVGDVFRNKIYFFQKKWNENETTIRENIPQTHTTTRDSRQTRMNTYRIRRRMYRNIFNEKKTRKKTERRKTEKTERKPESKYSKRKGCREYSIYTRRIPAKYTVFVSFRLCLFY